VSALLEWWKENQDDFPWRETKDPWKILISEILLQQTQAKRMIPYYQRIIEASPTPKAMVENGEEYLLKLWEGAGYYRRARYLFKLAEMCQNGLPDNYEDWLALPGIGPYTAAAICSIAFNLNVSCIDGNVKRIISRLVGRNITKFSEFKRIADQLIDKARPGDWNQALMDLGRNVCKPANPNCDDCPLSEGCIGKQDPMSFSTPKKVKSKLMKVDCLVILGKDGTLNIRRKASGHLQNMWGFELTDRNEASFKEEEYCGNISHAFTHRKWDIDVYAKKTAKMLIVPGDVPMAKLDQKIRDIVLAWDVKRNNS
tara:strand:- start:1662 stop:2600 length:939 start_codon:yes stop_codon:yes gene_type:complete